MSLLGVDVGTSSCKAVAFANGGVPLASASVPYARGGGTDEDNELDPVAFWDGFREAVWRTAAATTRDPVEALAVSGHGETIIPIGADGTPCGPALLNRDNRSGSSIHEWESEFGREEVYARTGLTLHSMYSLPKLRWLSRHRSQEFAYARRFCSVTDFLLGAIGMPPAIDYTMAARTMGFDIRQMRWSGDLLEFAGLRASSLSEALPSGTLVGRLGSKSARTLGLGEGVAVVLGAHDQPCGAYGAGALARGDAVDSAGSYECVTLVGTEPTNGPAALRYSLNAGPHVLPGRYITLAFYPSGLVVDWLMRKFLLEETADESTLQSTLEALQVEVEKLGPGPTGICLTPHLIGSCNPDWNVRASLSASGIRAHHGRLHLCKALFEGIACELAKILAALEEVGGPIGRCAIFGGGSRWEYGVQLRANISGRTLARISGAEMVCRGAALLAGAGSGVYRSLEDAALVTAPSFEDISPDEGAAALYAGQKRRYSALYEGLAAYRSLDAFDGASVPGSERKTPAGKGGAEERGKGG